MTIKTRKVWVLFGPNGGLFAWATRDTRSDVAQCAEFNFHETWRHWYRRGWRIVRAELRYPVKGKGK